MKNSCIQVTAKLSSHLCVSNDWTPMLESILESVWLDDRGLSARNPLKIEDTIEIPIPLRSQSVKSTKFYSASSPLYIIKNESVTYIRYRWDYQEHHCDWGKKKAQVFTQGFHTKYKNTPLRLVETDQIDWFCVGDKNQLIDMLNKCTHVGGHRARGYGQVDEWIVNKIDDDWSLWQGDRLMRPFPVRLLPEGIDVSTATKLFWGWKTPIRCPENREECVMPSNTIHKDKINLHNIDYFDAV